MSLTGVGCRLQTCSRLASERFDSAFRAMTFIDIGPKLVIATFVAISIIMLQLATGRMFWLIISSFL